MLVLSRKKLESIRIGENIEITVLALSGNRVRLGLRCPQSLTIRRGELDPPAEMMQEGLITLEAELV